MSTTLDQTGTALHRAILESPGDDALRLVYADWLEETGDDRRAGFLRCQIELARLKKEPCHCSSYDPTGCARCRSAVRLQKQADAAARPGIWKWLALREYAWGRFRLSWPTLWRLEAECKTTDWKQVFRRGLVESVEMTTADFLRHAEELFSRHPITEVKLIGKEADGYGDDTSGCQWSWYAWGLDDSRAEGNDVPDAIFAHLQGGLRPPERYRQPDLWWFYDTQAAALADLSRACVRHGRSLAGLPALSQEDNR